ncbi:MAG: hypothetical protein ACXWP5_01265 [Bdellovibrionota bacterium]
MRRQTRFCILIASFFALSCATPVKKAGKGIDPKLLLANACAPGAKVVSAKGSVKMSAKSREASGQFPAQVDVSAGKLYLEITNLLGGTEATITIDHGHYVIDASKQKTGGVREGNGSWGGIPLRWATELFLGRIPCPSADDQKTARLSTSAEGDLIAEVPRTLGTQAEKFVYRFRETPGGPWPDFLRWEQGEPAVRMMEFKFDEPEDETRSPRHWEARSDQGEVKVRWREREVSH